MIKVQNLTKIFKTSKKFPGFWGSIKGLFTREYTEKVAVNDISFEIAPGDIVGYIGSNGAGKSTTIKIMTGILTPTSGQVLVDGIEPYKNRQKNAKNIGVVFGQRTQLWWDLPLNESFSLLRDIYEVPEEDYKERMEFFTNVLGLDEFIMQPVRTLSLGQRMKADLAASLLHNPKILFLDEPTIGLDVVVKEKVRQAIKEIHAKYGTTIILTTHDLQDIEELCSKIIIIDEGRLVYIGSREDLLESFGSGTVLNIRFAPQEQIDEDTLKNLFLEDKDLSKKGTLSFSSNDGNFSIAFSKKEFSSSEILKIILQKYQIEDFSVEATSIEDIVKKIYNQASLERTSKGITE